jgi:phosphohistidine phosphatase
MILTIWRHGEAESGSVDRQRELTPGGREDIGFGCQQFYRACANRRLPQPTHILHSPYERTAQTAEMIESAFTHATGGEAYWLAPQSSIATIDQTLLRDFDGRDYSCHVVLVSHQPLVSNLVNWYAGEKGAAVPPLHPGGLVTITMDVVAAACGQTVFWAMPPEYEVGI